MNTRIVRDTFFFSKIKTASAGLKAELVMLSMFVLRHRWPMFTDEYSEIPIVYYKYIHAKNHKFIYLCGSSWDKINKYTNYKSIINSIIKVLTYRMQMLHTFPWHTKYIDLRAFCCDVTHITTFLQTFKTRYSISLL